MNISRKKFVFAFILLASFFMFASTSLLGSTGFRGFPKQPDTLLQTASPIEWKRTVSTIITPIKIVVIGPLVLTDNFLQDDPPPPLIGVYLFSYWAVLALVVHYLLAQRKRVI